MIIATKNATISAGATTRVLLTGSLLHVDDILRAVSDVTFDFDRVFLKPCAKEFLQSEFDSLRLFLIIAHLNNGGMMVLGHADQTGEANYNVRLTQRRARSVFAYLTKNVAEWHSLRNDPEEGPGKWETREAQYILQSLGFYRGYVDNTRGDLTNNALRAFTTDRLGAPSITLNDSTWDALLTAYMEDGYSEPPFDSATDFRSPAHAGCGFRFPRIGAPGLRLEANRRVEILLFKDGTVVIDPNCDFYQTIHLRVIPPPQQNVTVDIEIQLQDEQGQPVSSLPGLSEFKLHDPRGGETTIQLQGIGADGRFNTTRTGQIEGQFELEFKGDFIVFHPDTPEQRSFNHFCQHVTAAENKLVVVIRPNTVVLTIERLAPVDRRQLIPLAPGQQVTLNVTATPRIGANVLGQINIVSHDNQGTISTAVVLSASGEAVAAPHLNVIEAGPLLDFGQLTTGQGSNLRVIHVRNTGSADLLDVDATITGANAGEFTFSASSPLPLALAPGTEVILFCIFIPTAVGLAQAQLNITTSNGGNLNRALQGQGVGANSPNMLVGPSRLVFDETTEEATSVPQSVIIRNTGTANLTGVNFALAGPDANHFASVTSGALPSTLAPGQQLEVCITFTPDSVTFLPPSSPINPIQYRYETSLNITTANGGNAEIPLLGFAVAAPEPTLSITPRRLDFGAVVVGTTSAVQIVTVQNTGTVPKTIDFQVGGDAPQHFAFTTVPASPFVGVFEPVPLPGGFVLAGDRLRIKGEVFPQARTSIFNWTVTEQGGGQIFENFGTPEDGLNQIEFDLPRRAMVAQIECAVFAPGERSYSTQQNVNAALVRFVRDNNNAIAANRIQIEGVLNANRAAFNPATDLDPIQRDSIVRLAVDLPGFTPNNFNAAVTSLDSNNNVLASLNNVAMNRSAGDTFLSANPMMALTPDNQNPNLPGNPNPPGPPINAPGLDLMVARAEGTIRVDFSLLIGTNTQNFQRALQTPVQGRIVFLHVKNVATSTSNNAEIATWLNWANAAWSQLGLEIRFAHNTPVVVPDPGSVFANLQRGAGNFSTEQELLFALSRSQPRYYQIYITQISSSPGLRGQHFNPSHFPAAPSVVSRITALAPQQLTDNIQNFGAQRYAGANLLVAPDLFTVTQNNNQTLTIAVGNLTAAHAAGDPYCLIGLNKGGTVMVLAQPTHNIGSFETMAHEFGHGLIDFLDEHDDPANPGTPVNINNLMADGSVRNIPTYDLIASQRAQVFQLLNKAQGNILLINFIFLLH